MSDFFQALVSDLAARYDAPPFQPHLTLIGSDFHDAFDFSRLDEIQTPAAIELQIDSIQFSEKYTKTLFVRFQPHAELTALRAAVARAIGEDASDDYDPHVSLIYKTMPAEKKAELARNIELPFERVPFDAIKAVAVPEKIETAADVEAWRDVWQRRLVR
jgi:hypothetical protein